jgi:hypothetical protein
MQTYGSLGATKRRCGIVDLVNPAEYVWAQADRDLPNGVPDNLRELRARLTDATRRLRRSQDLLWSINSATTTCRSCLAISAS